MRTATLLATLFVLTTLALPLAAAHHTHSGCTSATKVDAGVVHVDKYYPPCSGMTVSTAAECFNFGQDIHFRGYHILILRGHGCQTGVINGGSGSLLP